MEVIEIIKRDQLAKDLNACMALMVPCSTQALYRNNRLAIKMCFKNMFSLGNKGAEESKWHAHL